MYLDSLGALEYVCMGAQRVWSYDLWVFLNILLATNVLYNTHCCMPLKENKAF